MPMDTSCCKLIITGGAAGKYSGYVRTSQYHRNSTY